jgi:hypothetical protein
MQQSFVWQREENRKERAKLFRGMFAQKIVWREVYFSIEEVSNDGRSVSNHEY